MKNNDVALLQNMLDSNHYDQDVMDSILSNYLDDPPIMVLQLPAGSKILRSSPNTDSTLHENVSRLGCPPSKFARTDRASLQGKPMFYGSIFTSSAIETNALPRIMTAFETIGFLREYNATGLAFTTHSLWLPTRDLRLFAFPFSKKYKKPCQEIKFAINTWHHVIKSTYDEKDVEFARFVSDLLSSKNYSCLYDITAHIIDAILYKSSWASKLDGILYPSVWGEGQGLNICLKKDTVDRCVNFSSAMLVRIDKVAGNAKVYNIAHSLRQSDDSLKWVFTPQALSLLVERFGFQELLDDGVIEFGEVKTK